MGPTDHVGAAAPKRRRTQEERRAETSGKLLDATIDLLLEKGYSRFRIADAASKAGVSRGGQTHHFSTKNGLVEAAIERVFEAEVGVAESEASRAAHADIVRQSAHHVEEFLRSKLYRVCLNMLISTGASDELADRVRAISARSRAPIEQAWIARLVASGFEREQAESALFLLWNVQRGLAIQELFEGDSQSLGDTLEFTIELVNEYLRGIDRQPSLG